MIYAIFNSEGKCVNRAVWDGESDWQPPDGCTAVPDPDNLHPIYVEPQPEVVRYLDENDNEVDPTQPEEETVLVRARNEDGTYVADDPITPENEAWTEPSA